MHIRECFTYFLNNLFVFYWLNLAISHIITHQLDFLLEFSIYLQIYTHLYTFVSISTTLFSFNGFLRNFIYVWVIMGEPCVYGCFSGYSGYYINDLYTLLDD